MSGTTVEFVVNGKVVKRATLNISLKTPGSKLKRKSTTKKTKSSQKSQSSRKSSSKKSKQSTNKNVTLDSWVNIEDPGDSISKNIKQGSESEDSNFGDGGNELEKIKERTGDEFQSYIRTRMTRRQRMNLKKKLGEEEVDHDVFAEEDELIELPMKPQTKGDQDSEEDEFAKIEKAKKRRLQAQKHDEEVKRQTIERILNEPGRREREREKKSRREQKIRQQYEANDDEDNNEPPETIRYVNSRKRTALDLPSDMKFPIFLQGHQRWAHYEYGEGERALSLQEAKETADMIRAQCVERAKTVCVVENCGKPRKYDCSKTKQPLCSLECYKKHIAAG